MFLLSWLFRQFGKFPWKQAKANKKDSPSAYKQAPFAGRLFFFCEPWIHFGKSLIFSSFCRIYIEFLLNLWYNIGRKNDKNWGCLSRIPGTM